MHRIRIYCIEAAGLFGFIFLAGLTTVFLEHPRLPVQQTALARLPVVRHLILGLLIGGYTVIAAKASRRSGGHNNPAVSLSFWLLGRMRAPDLAGYIAAQFTGGTAAALLLKILLGHWFSHPVIYYGATRPQPPHGQMDALIAETIISFVLMSGILVTASSRRWEKATPWVIGFLIALFLTVELPYSGMSMNPARSFAGDVAAGNFDHLWIYIIAPVGAMCAAALLFPLYRRWRLRSRISAADVRELPRFPENRNSGAGQTGCGTSFLVR